MILLLFFFLSCQLLQQTKPLDVRQAARSVAADTLHYEMKSLSEEYGDCQSESPAECVSVSALFPLFKDNEDMAISDSINDRVRSYISSTQEDTAESFGEMASELIRQYQELRSDMPEMMTAWNLERKVEVVNLTPAILALAFSEYAYLGGAHPNHFISCYNFNLNNGKQIVLQDILIENGQQELDEIAEKLFREQKGLSPDSSLEDAGYWFENNTFQVNENFAILPEGLGFHYNPYEIASYAAGATELLIPFELIDSLLKKNVF